MVAKVSDGKRTPVPGNILTSKAEIRRFARSIVRQEVGKNRTSRFDKNTFMAEDYLPIFEGSNSKVELE
jgi:hypothetical protein